MAKRITGLSDVLRVKLGAYVYLLLDPRDQSVFYIGKGSGSRVLDHGKEARKSERPSRKLARIREIEAADHEVILKLHRTGMTDQEALEVEGALIDVYPDALNEADGRHNRNRGAMTLEEFIALHDAKPAAIGERAVLIDIRQEWHRGLAADPSKLQERTCRYWNCRPDSRPIAPEYVLSVALGIIRGVYKIRGWTRQDMAGVAFDPSRTGTRNRVGKSQVRCEFDLTPAPRLKHYVGKSVAHLQKPGAQNPIRYVNC